MGLVSRVVEAEELEEVAQGLAEELAAGAPLAQSLTKAILNRSLELSLEAALAYEAQAQAVCLSSQDAREGLAAFRERREPRFRGR